MAQAGEQGMVHGTQDKKDKGDIKDKKYMKSRKTIGRTASGKVFEVPHTTDMVSTILDPRQPKSEWDMVIIGTIAIHVAFYCFTDGSFRKASFLLIYVFWRAMYNVGIGYVLHHQSHHNMLVEKAQQYQIFERTNHPRLYEFIKRQLSDKMGPDYDFEKSPIEYRTWLLFRRGVDLILMLDFCSYVLMSFAWAHVPVGHGIVLQSLRWSAGWLLVLFNLWVKLDANRVVKDFAWYWGDFFYLIDSDLTFDGVYELCMHPMYSLGYAGYYGISLLACSYTVLFTSIMAHISQFVFLYVVEEPHIDKTYNPKSRVCVKSKYDQARRFMSSESAFAESKDPASKLDEFNYDEVKINKDIQVFRVFDLHRTIDFAQVLLAISGVLFAVFTPQVGNYRTFSVALAFTWRLIHSFGILYSLRGQSQCKSWTKHFWKIGLSPRKAWHEWRGIYALSLTVMHVTFLCAAWKSYSIPTNWQYGTVTLRHVLGLALVAMHVWTSISVYDVLGDFGWYFGDFFVDNPAPKLRYTGVYRYLNSPERIVYSFWGFALISNSTAVLWLAIEAQILNLVFISFIEKPHMHKLYGEQVRKEAGFTRSLKSMPVLEHHRVRIAMQRIERTIDLASDFTSQSIGKCLNSIHPHIHQAIEQSKIRVNRYQNSIMIPQIADNIDRDSLEQYTISLSRDSGNIYALGEPICARWAAPLHHGSKDWIGIYSITDNLSGEITRVSSQGRWSAIHKGAFKDHQNNIVVDRGNDGVIELRGDTLPWTTGVYELRYHHNGKHNVMAVSPPFEIDVEVSQQSDNRQIEQDLIAFIGTILSSERGTDVPKSPDDIIFFADDAEKIASRIAYGIHKRYHIDFAWQLIASDASIRNITARIARSRKILAPLVTYQGEGSQSSGFIRKESQFLKEN